jgi:hypothetical protein
MLLLYLEVQDTDSIQFGEPEVVVSIHRQCSGLPCTGRQRIRDKPPGRMIQTGQPVFGKDRDPDISRRRDDQPIEPTRPRPCQGSLVESERRGGRIEANQQAGGEGGRLDGALGITGKFHQGERGSWHCEEPHADSHRIKAATTFGTHLRKPDHAVWSHGNPVGGTFSAHSWWRRGDSAGRVRCVDRGVPGYRRRIR